MIHGAKILRKDGASLNGKFRYVPGEQREKLRGIG